MAVTARSVTLDGSLIGVIGTGRDNAVHPGVVALQITGTETGDLARASGTAAFTISGEHDLSSVTGECSTSWSRVGSISIWFPTCDVSIRSMDSYDGLLSFMWITTSIPGNDTTPMRRWTATGCAAAHC